MDEGLIKQKREAWAVFGQSFNEKEMQLQAQAQTALAQLIIPTSMEEVVAAEAALKLVKADKTRLDEERKETFGRKLEGLQDRLIKPIKSFDDPIAKATNAIIELKKLDAKKREAEAEKIKERKTIKESILNQMSDFSLQYKIRVSDILKTCYENALNAKLTGETLASFIVQAKGLITKTDSIFSYKLPKLEYSSIEDVKEIEQAIQQELSWPDAENYLSAFHKLVDQRFENFDIALNNIEDALRLVKEEAKEEIEKNEQVAKMEVIANQIDAAATPMLFEYASKELKEVYVLDMPNTMNSMVQIIGAFMAYSTECLPKIRVKNWMNFDAEAAGKALCKLKQEKPEIQFRGVVFKKEHKL